jgi:hypothetical protein
MILHNLVFYLHKSPKNDERKIQMIVCHSQSAQLLSQLLENDVITVYLALLI